MYLKFKAKGRDYEVKTPYSNPTLIERGRGLVSMDGEDTYIVQDDIASDTKRRFGLASVCMSDLKEGDFASFYTITVDRGSTTWMWNSAEWNVLEENDAGDTIARY